MFIRFDTTHERDRHTHTDRHRMTAWPRLCIASRCKNDGTVFFVNLLTTEGAGQVLVPAHAKRPVQH